MLFIISTVKQKACSCKNLLLHFYGKVLRRCCQQALLLQQAGRVYPVACAQCNTGLRATSVCAAQHRTGLCLLINSSYTMLCQLGSAKEILGVIMIHSQDQSFQLLYEESCYISIVHYLSNKLEKILLIRRRTDNVLCCLTFLEGKTD